MQICRTVEEIREAVSQLRANGGTVALVPTMGALHEGHMALVEQALREADHVVASIFINPSQFENPDDLDAYPRTLEDDLDRLREAGVIAVFTPEVSDMYPEGSETIVETTRLANILHGKVRPGHFRGVATVVCKLLNIVMPDVALFGEKDYQQLAVIRRMVRDLFMTVRIVGVPTVRAADGLALSSRNVNLSAEERAAATVLSKSLTVAEELVRNGTDVEALRKAVADRIKSEPRAQLRAVDIADAETLEPVTGPVKAPVALMISAEFGSTLLIDQRVAHP